MEKITLQAPAIIGPKRYPAGSEITATPEAVERGIARAFKADLRSKIQNKAGDALSLLGSLSDIADLFLMHTIADVIAISEHSENDAQRRRLEIMQSLAGDHDVVALAQSTLARIQSGEVMLTADLKGLTSVLDEVLDRSTETAKVLSDAAPET
ncbi:hypothetical protein [Epibacterium ulvae]|uniref:hypothetical protein n=1 Tax=Epibacterium ulvae TaxID=1156985 RepID=UPI002490025B|nr:hypothetical protein [Epibacterium ulvae]